MNKSCLMCRKPEDPNRALRPFCSSQCEHVWRTGDWSAKVISCEGQDGVDYESCFCEDF